MYKVFVGGNVLEFDSLQAAKQAAKAGLKDWTQKGDKIRFLTYSPSGFPLLARVYDSVGEPTDSMASIEKA